MNKQYWKTAVLGILIVGCIIQTTALWLGGMPSHNFLTSYTPIYKGVAPQKIWLLAPTVTGSSSKSALAYAVSQTTQATMVEHERLIVELQKVLQMMTEDKKVTIREGIDWQTLFALPGIMYTYTEPMTLRDIIGDTKNSDTLKTVQNIDQIVIQSRSKFAKDVSVQLISTTENQMITLELGSGFQAFEALYDYVLQDKKETNAVAYQPSAVSNVSKYIAGNSFMPIASKSLPIQYPILETVHPIPEDEEQAIRALEVYTNEFFMNPLLKEKAVGKDGSITFKEEKKAIVVYNPIGTLEYVNLAPKIKTRTTLLGSYTKAVAFIDNTETLHDAVKGKVYLKEMRREGEAYVCLFDFNIEGYDIEMSESVKEALGLESAIQVRIEGDEITTVKMSLLVPIIKSIGGRVQEAQLYSEYVNPINKGLEEIKKAGYESIVFDESKAMYVMDNLKGDMLLTRGILFEGRWYYPY